MTDRVSEWLCTGELAILLLASPFFLLFRPAFAPILLLLPILWLARRRCRGHFIPRTVVDWPILGLLIMTMTSMFVTPDLNASLDKIVGLIYAIAIFYAMIDWAQCKDSPVPVAALLTGLATATALLGLVGTDWQVKWPIMEQIRPYLPQAVRNLPGAASGFHPNTVSGTLITFVPLQVSFLWALVSARTKSIRQHRWLTVGVALSLVLTTVMLFLAQSRSALVMLIFGLLLMVGVILKRFRWFLFAIVLLAVILLLIVGPVGISEWFVQQGVLANSGEMSWVARVERWSRWLWGIADFPLTGTGMDVFRWAAWDMYPFFHAPLYQDLGHAHNLYLHTALDLGIPGLVFYLALLLSTMVAGWLMHRRIQHQLTQLIFLGGLAGLATHALWSFVDVLPLGARTNFLWWTVLALVATIMIRADWGDSNEQAASHKQSVQEPHGLESTSA